MCCRNSPPCAFLHQAKEDRAALQAEVQHLREDNLRLQEESQTASAQLKKFTEWVFNTIDMKWLPQENPQNKPLLRRVLMRFLFTWSSTFENPEHFHHKLIEWLFSAHQIHLCLPYISIQICLNVKVSFCTYLLFVKLILLFWATFVAFICYHDGH